MTTFDKSKQGVNLKINFNEISELQSPKSVASQPTYEQKLKEAEELNAKLKILYTNLKNNTNLKKLELESALQSKQEKSAIKQLRRQSQKMALELQYITQSLNMMISQNQKLKEEVDNSRNSRVIYSNVYKNLQKEIRKMEYMYKLAIIDNKATEDTHQKIAEKMDKNIKKLEKQIESMEYKMNLRIKRTAERSRINQSRTTNRGSQYTELEQSRKHITMKTEKQSQRVYLSQKEPSVEKRKQQETMKQDGVDRIKDKFMRSKQRLATPKSSDQYEIQMKINYYDNLVKKLQEATKLDEIQEILTIWKNIDESIEHEYQKYLNYEEQLRKIENEQSQILLKIKSLQDKDQKHKSTVINGKISQQEKELQRLRIQIEKQTQTLKENQAILTQKIDIISENLTNQELLHHIARVKQRNKTEFHGKTLQKILQSAQKQKAVDNCIILPKNLSDSHVIKRN